jgi:hypothetical protein
MCLVVEHRIAHAACSMHLGLRDCERLAHVVGAVASFNFLGNRGIGLCPAAELCRGLTQLIDGVVMLLRMPRQCQQSVATQFGRPRL